MEVKRKIDWEVGFVRVTRSYRDLPMEWGRSDCLNLVSDVCEAMTGHDPMAEERGIYASEEEAQEVLRSLGYADVEEALAARFQEVPVAQARRGDAGIVEVRGVKAAVVVLGPNVMGRHMRGSFFLPSLRMARAFKMGW